MSDFFGSLVARAAGESGLAPRPVALFAEVRAEPSADTTARWDAVVVPDGEETVVERASASRVPPKEGPKAPAVTTDDRVDGPQGRRPAESSPSADIAADAEERGSGGAPKPAIAAPDPRPPAQVTPAESPAQVTPAESPALLRLPSPDRRGGQPDRPRRRARPAASPPKISAPAAAERRPDGISPMPAHRVAPEPDADVAPPATRPAGTRVTPVPVPSVRAEPQPPAALPAGQPEAPPPMPEIPAPRAAATEPARTVVEISIGRVEIHSRPAPPQPARRPATPGAATLGDYLAARRGRGA